MEKMNTMIWSVLKKHFKDRWRPIQIIFAGKTHPANDPGKRLLQDLINLARDPQLGGRIAFVEDYGQQKRHS